MPTVSAPPGPPIAVLFGGTGFIGRHIVWRLARMGWVLRIATRRPVAARSLRPAGVVGQIVPVPVNMRDPAAVRAVLEGATHAVNLIGILAESRGQSFRAVHGEVAERIAQAAAAARLDALVHVSSLGASPHAPSAYQRSKAAGEKAVLKAFPRATILRPSIVFGPDDGFFNLFANLARFLPALPLIGGGGTLLQPVFVEDVAAAAVLALTEARHQGRTYELGGPRVYSFKTLLQKILEETGRRRPLVSIGWELAGLQGAILERLPGRLLTQDQVQSLKVDNIVMPGAAGFDELGLSPTALELILPTYLDKYRVGGRFAARRNPGGVGTGVA